MKKPNARKKAQATAKLKEIRDQYSRERKNHLENIVTIMMKGYREAQKLKSSSAQQTEFYEEAGVKLRGRSAAPDLLTEVMVFIACAKGKSGRKLAWKRARVMEYLHERKRLGPHEILATIKKNGGIEKTYRQSTRKKQAPRKNEGQAKIRTESKKGWSLRKDGYTYRAPNETRAEKIQVSDPRTLPKNDQETLVLAAINMSDLDELREMEVNQKAKLIVRRITGSKGLIRIKLVKVFRKTN